MSILIGIFTFALILVSLFLILVILSQKSKSDGGMGAALGGGMAEATFGADTGNVLTKSTINACIAFFVISFGLYLAHLHESKAPKAGERALPSIAAPADNTLTTSDAVADETLPASEVPAETIDSSSAETVNP